MKKPVKSKPKSSSSSTLTPEMIDDTDMDVLYRFLYEKLEEPKLKRIEEEDKARGAALADTSSKVMWQSADFKVLTIKDRADRYNVTAEMRKVAAAPSIISFWAMLSYIKLFLIKGSNILQCPAVEMPKTGQTEPSEYDICYGILVRMTNHRKPDGTPLPLIRGNETRGFCLG